MRARRWRAWARSWRAGEREARSAMRVGACYVSGEGVVFGADSTTTMLVAGRGIATDHSEHHFEHAQKIFEIGEGSTLGVVTWGMGNLEDVSFRTLIAL